MSSEDQIRSADQFHGWRTHFRRMERWQRRAVNALSDLPKTDVNDALDYALAYFIWSHSLREWLLNDPVMENKQDDLDRHLNADLTWPIIKDLANRSKHKVIDRNPTDANWSVSREYDPFAVHREGHEKHKIILLHKEEKYELVRVVEASGDMWNGVLREFDLHVVPPSGET